MNKTDAWMPLWIGDYLADTQHLTRDEHGAYLLLLMAYWRNGGPIPDDDRRLASIVKASPKEWKALRPVMLEFFRVEGDQWHQKRVDTELARSSDRSEKAASKAKKAAEARWKECKSNAPSNAPSIPQALHKECPSPSPSQRDDSSLRSESLSARGGTLAGQACRLIREAGVRRTNPSDPRLLQLLSQGVTPQQLGDLAVELVEAGNAPESAAYVLRAMEGRLRAAAAQPEHPPGTAQRATAPRGTAYGDEIDRIAASIRRGASPSPETVDVEVRRVG